MKKLAEMVFILVVRSISLAGATSPNEIPTVYASVQVNDDDPSVTSVSHAETLASQMFARAGVDVLWHTHEALSNRNPQPIVIEIVPKAVEKFTQSTLAYAHPLKGRRVTIFWDRLQGSHDEATTTALLAHVLVHEITHILECSDRHSGEGIMKAHWTAQDIWQMSRRPLSFEPSDVRLIHAGLAARDRANEGIREQISAR